MNLAITAPRSKSRISLTPLIDVVFILLLFFMLTSTFSSRSVLGLSSPISAPKQIESEPEILRIQMTRSELIVAGEQIELSRLDQVLANTSVSVTGVVIETTSGVVLEDTVFVMDKIKQYDLGPTSLIRAEQRP